MHLEHKSWKNFQHFVPRIFAVAVVDAPLEEITGDECGHRANFFKISWF